MRVKILAKIAEEQGPHLEPALYGCAAIRKVNVAVLFSSIVMEVLVYLSSHPENERRID